MNLDLSTLGPLAGSLIKAGAPTLGSLVGGLVGGPLGGIAGDLAGNVLGSIAGALGSPPDAPPEVIQAKIEADPQAAAAALAPVESEYRLEIEDRANARQQTIELAKAGSEVAWGAPVVSVIATLGFVAVAIAILSGRAAESGSGQLILGAMISGYTTVLAYWLGSSSSSRRNGDAVRAIAAQVAPPPVAQRPAKRRA